MTQNNKPEWFEITDKDEKPELRKVSKSLPISAVLVTALILGIGAVAAQTQDQTPASAVVAMDEQGQPSQSNSAVINPTSQANSAVINPTTAAAVGVASVGVASVAGNKLANPAISQLPTGGDDDDDDDEDEDEDEDDD